jgi:hypothetical protein
LLSFKVISQMTASLKRWKIRRLFLFTHLRLEFDFQNINFKNYNYIAVILTSFCHLYCKTVEVK